MIIDQSGKISFLGVDFRNDIWYPNFSGAIDPSGFNGPVGVNPAGQPIGRRSFKLVIRDPQDAEYLNENGWNLKYYPAKQEGDTDMWALQIFLNYKFPKYAPVIWTENSNGEGKVELNETTVDSLDKLDILSVDLTITPYDWKMQNGNSGRKAELYRMRAIIEDLPF